MWVWTWAEQMNQGKKRENTGSEGTYRHKAPDARRSVKHLAQI